MAFRRTPVLYHAMSKWAYNWSGFNKYGLYRDDCLWEGDPDVEEALRRIPKWMVDERNFRLIQAIQLSIQKQILPKEKWIQYENDVMYLSPIVEQVRKERLEREKWEGEY